MIDRNSRGTVALVYGLSIVAAAALVCFVHISWLVWPLLALLLWFCVWQTFFFRVPKRHCNGSGSKISSVADGKVVIIEKTFEKEYLKCECIQVSVYMNFFDVHANFWPADGEVSYYKYYPGKHLLAFKPKASEENEHSCTGLTLPGGERIFFKQIAGGFARRIVCYAHRSSAVKAGEQCGIIKFGSRIDLFLPLDAELKVAIGDYVRACESVIAELPAGPSSVARQK